MFLSDMVWTLSRPLPEMEIMSRAVQLSVHHFLLGDHDTFEQGFFHVACSVIEVIMRLDRSFQSPQFPLPSLNL